ncbi:flagellar biosynthesis protein [Oceanicola sp. 22II-s10i]|uniref:flagellar biosynthetic protein FliR n=1 Tax=Oceanicola sp. 22II-s10i TaxID=1317116 RepID=UPI000B524824|nr:flagellar biosynthetic protein FliR [Oceanicola sp. 22II-s10i]OWU83165.1 flagellar biosynthesis protein [Oceanicola sp. 22II-s10i]
MNIAPLLTAEFLGAALVFARIGGILMFIPAFGEAFIPVRHRLAMAIVLALVIYATGVQGPIRFDTFGQLAGALAIEVTIGVWIGMVGRILLTGLQFAGYQVGLISSLSNAFAPSMGSFQGSTLISTGLMLGGVAVIFATDLHHVIIGAMAMSYQIFPAGALMPGDLSQQIVRATGQSFYLGMSIAAPFYVMGILLNLGLGLTNRMMPNLPVFFVAGPVLIVSGLIVLTIASPYMLREFAERFGEWLGLLTF